MAENIFISKTPPASIASDYTQLRELGIGYIEHFGSDFWTDYNKHDPGITTLEMLCYAITDLSLRTQLPIADLITSSFGSEQAVQEDFLTADLIMPTSPITELDYRKLFIDIKGVQNAWLTKAEKTVFVDCKKQKLKHSLPQSLPSNEKWTHFDLNGLYNVLIEFEETVVDEDAKIKIKDAVKETYISNRCLCEDIVEVAEVPIQKIMICADIDLVNEVNVAAVHAQVLFEIENYLSPFIKRYSLQELQDKKMTLDEIFEGPLLTNGFILDSELIEADLKGTVYTSDLINIVMGIEINGKKVVKAIQKVGLNKLITDTAKPCGEWKTKEGGSAAWCLHIDKGYQAQLCAERSTLNFFKNGIPLSSTTNKAVAISQFRQLQKDQHSANVKKVEAPPVPTGTIYPIEEYTSIINDFPQTYGIGQYGLPKSASVERQAKAKQLKAYLLFFDQFLANYLAQLKNLKTLFSNDSEAATYFSQSVKGINGIGELYNDFSNLDNNLTTSLKKWEGYNTNPERKNRFLDHILARFAEDFSEYAMLTFSLFDDFDGTTILKNKAAFITDFCQRPKREIGQSVIDWETVTRTHFRNINHAHAYNYCESAWNTDNVAGVTRRIARVLGMSEFKAVEPSTNQDERIFLLENILLFPDKSTPTESNPVENDSDKNWFHVCTEPDCTHCRPLDPYSYRVSIVLPGYTDRFRNINFRRYAERVIREELPAHVLARICWVKEDYLQIFAEKYRNWLEQKNNQCTTIGLGAYETALQDLLEILDKLYTVYPSGVLHDCDNPDEIAPIMLGRSALGTLKPTIE